MIDILQIRKYDVVMDELNPSYDNGNGNGELEIIDETKELEDRGHECLWDDFDDYGNDVFCKLLIIPNTNGTLPDFCPKHIEELKNWLDILELYINDILKLCEPVLIKKMNKEQSGWKKRVEEELGMTRYLIIKFVNDKYQEGLLAKSIAELLDNLDE